MDTSPTDPARLSLHGRTAVITGANRGVGLATAISLAQAGARIVLAVRNRAAGERAAAVIPGKTDVRALDLADFASIRAFVGELDGDIDLLINNAGVMVVPQGRTADGFELHMGINHLGHFALTNLLLPQITGRVVTLASGAHRSGRLDLDDLNGERGYHRWGAYARSKLANLLFTAELARRLAEVDSPVLSVAAHPGYAPTDLSARSTTRVERTVMRLGNRFVARSHEQAAWPTLHAATADVPSGAYIGPGGITGISGPPAMVKRSARASDAVLARQLWERSEALTGTRFVLLPTGDRHSRQAQQ